MYPNFSFLRPLSLKLLLEVITAIPSRYMTLTTSPFTNFQSSLSGNANLAYKKQALSTGKGCPTRWDSLFLSPFMPERNIPVPTKAFTIKVWILPLHVYRENVVRLQRN